MGKQKNRLTATKQKPPSPAAESTWPEPKSPSLPYTSSFQDMPKSLSLPYTPLGTTHTPKSLSLPYTSSLQEATDISPSPPTYPIPPFSRRLYAPRDGTRPLPYAGPARGPNIGEIEAKDGLPSADRNNKATLLLTGPFRTAKSSAKDLTPLVLKLQCAKYRGALPAPRRNRLLRR
jgi:hypothetical protein